MVALEAPSPSAVPVPAAPPPLSPAQSAFLYAYAEARSDIRSAARKLQIPLETALSQFADPALQAYLALLDESQKRAARETAIGTIHQAIAGLNRAMEYKGDPSHTAKASGHLARAALWLVRIAEGKVGPDALPHRYARPPRTTPERPPPSSAEVASANLEQALKSLERLRNQAPEILARAASLKANQNTSPEAGMQPDRQGGHSAQQPAQEPTAPIGAPGANSGHASVPSDSRTPSPRCSASPASLITRAGSTDSS